jgi:4-amino-4-deoxy-L-arabinose transferase-like glycosyltransferase
LEKPVLYYWQAMVAYKVFGVSDWAARLPSAIDATLMVVAVFLFLRRFRPGLELDGALITASAAGIIGFARAASMDMALAATFTIAMLAWYVWNESANKIYLAVFYGFIALGTLAKGPIAPFLAAVVVIALAVTQKDLKIAIKMLWIPGLLIFLLVALPWYIAVQLRNPEFFSRVHSRAQFFAFRHQPLSPSATHLVLRASCHRGLASVDSFRRCCSGRNFTRMVETEGHCASAPGPVQSLSCDLVRFADLVFFSLPIQVARIHPAGPASGNAIAVCIRALSQRER